ncbi:hypothetical protein HX001_01935 [Empedobacter brevis]|uniref:Uncharacterized protein n=1 Tax=Empedobacter brevis TaxID=247 RepID=A0AAJ1QBZ0_9FLAO|nr:hypothetical protein [Empedobacter brevis]MDM1071246.1 hypothetical protein [Empedobacter brevis]QHC85412.1 hypothetical protein AS589_11780 [Empedobacter brevis]
MKNLKLLFLLGTSLFSLKGLSQTQTIKQDLNITKNQTSLSAKLSKYMKAQTEVNGFSGTVLITRKDAVLLREAYGLADYEWNIKISNNDSIILKKANVYHHTKNGLAHNPYINWEFNIGHDGVYSTVEDLALWDSYFIKRILQYL